MESNGCPAPTSNDSPETQPQSCIERALPVSRASCLTFCDKSKVTDLSTLSPLFRNRKVLMWLAIAVISAPAIFLCFRVVTTHPFKATISIPKVMYSYDGFDIELEITNASKGEQPIYFTMMTVVTDDGREMAYQKSIPMKSSLLPSESLTDTFRPRNCPDLIENLNRLRVRIEFEDIPNKHSAISDWVHDHVHYLLPKWMQNQSERRKWIIESDWFPASEIAPDSRIK